MKHVIMLLALASSCSLLTGCYETEYETVSYSSPPPPVMMTPYSNSGAHYGDAAPMAPAPMMMSPPPPPVTISPDSNSGAHYG